MPTDAPHTLSLKKYTVMVVVASVAVLVMLVLGLGIYGAWHDEWSGYNAGLSYSMDGSCNIAVIPISGDIIPYPGAYGQTADGEPVPYTDPDTVGASLRFAESDPHVRGAMFVIDSAGGIPGSSETIAHEIKSSPLPSLALVRAYATSGGYLIASATNHIVASAVADVGSIGVTSSYLEYSEKNETEGIRFVSLTSAPFKDYGNPEKALTADEQALIKRDLMVTHEEFVSQVADNRGMLKEDVAKIADGSSMPGTLALEHRLVDELGDKETAHAWFAHKLQIDPEEVIFCE